MSTYTRLRVSLVGLWVAVAGCATQPDNALLQRRTEWLYGELPAAEAPALKAGQAAAELDGVALAEASVDLWTLKDADLDAYVRIGLEHSASLRAAFEEWRAATERAALAATLPDPRLNFVEFIEEVQTRTGPQERRIGISQGFPWPGKLQAKSAVAAHEAEALWYGVESERLRVIAAIEVAYYDYAFLARELDTTHRLIELLYGLEPVVQSRVRAGAGQSSLLKLQVEVGRLEDHLASLERRRPVLSAQLAAAMTLKSASRQVLPMPILVEPASATIDVQQSFELAHNNNPELRAHAERMRAARKSEDLLAFQRRPEFSVGIDYIQTGDALNPATPGSGDDPVSVGFSMTLPIWSSSYTAADRQARAQFQAASQRFTAAETRIQANLEEQAYQVEDAARRIALYRDALIPRATEALDLTLASYRTGAASVLDLIDSERALLEFELSFWRACRESLQSQARLKALIGGVQQ
jgi:outer membrane protein, heavy metal efflux system